MKTNIKSTFCLISLLIAAGIFNGCGYTRQATLPNDFKKIFVDTTKNIIPVDDIYAYHPGMEMMITKAVIRRLNQDGNLQVVKREDADVILESRLLSLTQEGMRFTSLESVEEFRMFIVMAIRLVDAKTGSVLWEEPNFTGDAEYIVSDIRSAAREEGVERAVNRTARNIVDRIVEDW